MVTITHSAGVLVPKLVEGYVATREVRTVVHTILNSSSPVVSLRPPGLRSGSLRCLFPVQADAVSAFAVLSTPQVLTLHASEVPAVNMTFVVAGSRGSGELSIDLDDETRSVWWITVPFQEVAP